MRRFLLIFFAALICATSMEASPAVAVNGKLPGAFSVSPTKVVYFSQGNLQYTKSTGKWKIMDHQYDMVETLSQNVGTDYADQDVVTLFGWGTSGWDNTAADATSVHYQPYSTCKTDHSTANNNYQYGPSLANVAAGESWSKEVAGNHPYENYDWGVFNSGDLGAGWRTLTSTEWGYLFNSRTPGNSVNGVSNARYTEATINTDGTAVNGIILFPDDAVMTSVSGVTWGTINSSSAWGTKCTSAGWTALETAGCVFLPAAGTRFGTSVSDVGSYGRYWSSSANSATSAYSLRFYSGKVYPQLDYYRYAGYSVRLVSETAPSITDVPLTFEAMEDDATVTYTLQGSAPIQYSLNGGAWTDYSSAITLEHAGDKVSFRGNNTSYNSFFISCVFSCSKDCYIYGNIMSLISSTGYATATTLSAASTFSYMFYNNTHIKNHPSKALVLPATTLANNCYEYMFSGCTNLETAPALPASTLTEYCYYAMFQGCTGLTSAPALPATTLANSCCQEMFSGCTNLVTAPALPATTLASFCYTDMFSGCTNLETAPELPATTLADLCYYLMFEGCTGLTSAPELPATTLANGCYGSMFEGCTGLIDAPELPATTLANNCYEYMFSGCTNLETAPELPATTLAKKCYFAMFEGCTGLTSAPELPATTLAQGCYTGMFAGCTNLSSVTCYATARSSANDSYFWLDGVAESGTYYGPKNSILASDEPGASAIPEGWVFTPFQASISSTPTAIEDLVYTGSAQELVNAGTAEGGTMYYSLDNSSWSEDIPTATNAGDYTVYYMVAGDESHSDYTPTENSVAVSITPAPLTITADNKEIIYNEAAPNYTATYDGFVGGEDASVLSGTLALTCDYSAGDALGDYTITPSGLSSDKYAITYETGTLSVVSPDAITLPDNEDKTALLTALNGSTLEITIGRTIVAGPYNTFCLPFSLSESEIATSPLAGAILKDYNGADVTGTGAERDLNIYLTDLTDITAGKPFLIKTESNIVNPTFTSVTISYTAAMGANIEQDHVDFQGILAPYDLAAYSNSSPDYLGIGMDGRLYWADASLSSAPMRGFRAFFHVKDAGVANSPVRRGMHAQFVEYSPKTPTGVEGVQPSEISIQKILRDGHVTIIRNGVSYNVNGQIVK